MIVEIRLCARPHFSSRNRAISNNKIVGIEERSYIMKNKHLLVVVVLILIALALAACERSASTPPPEEGSATFPTLEGTQDPIEELNTFGTQTAVAQSGGEGEGEEEGEGEGQEGGESKPEEGEGETEEKPAEEPEATKKPEEKPEATPVPPKDYPVPNKWTLRKGEFPYCLARRFDVAPNALLSVNGLNSSSVTYAGQTLKIPKDAGSFNQGNRSLKAHPTNYTVRSGDTVYSIACQFGDVFPEAIEDVNGLSGAYTIQVGEVLKIP
jgi:LysM repeat protein